MKCFKVISKFQFLQYAMEDERDEADYNSFW